MENRTVDLFDHLRKLALLQNETISGWSILASASQYIRLGESDYRKWRQKHHNDESSVMNFYMRQSSIELFWCKCCEKLVKINDDHCPICGLVI